MLASFHQAINSWGSLLSHQDGRGFGAGGYGLIGLTDWECNVQGSCSLGLKFRVLQRAKYLRARHLYPLRLRPYTSLQHAQDLEKVYLVSCEAPYDCS